MEYAPKKSLNLDLDHFKAYSFVLIGSTRSGKSTLLNHIMDKYMKGKINILMTESPNGDIYKEGSFKKDCIMAPTYMPEIIKECYLIQKGTKNRYPFNFIMDDLVGFRSDKQMKKLLTIYRNSNMGVCITGQSVNILDTSARNNCNYVFLGRVNSDAEAENICKSFLASFFPPSMKMVERITAYRKITSDYHFICLDNINGESFITKIKI